MGQQPQQMQGVGMFRPHLQHLLAQPLRLVGLAGIPMAIGQGHRLLQAHPLGRGGRHRFGFHRFRFTGQGRVSFTVRRS